MDRLTVAPFNGKNFAVWKFQMRMFLEGHELYGVVDGSLQRTADNAADWMKKDSQARCFITCSLDQDLITQIIDCDTAEAMWTSLSKIHQHASETNSHIFLAEWFRYEMQVGESIANHIAKVKAMASQLKASKQEQTKDAILTKVIQGLPQKYANVIAAWRSMSPDDEKRTLDELSSRLVDHESMLSNWEKKDEEKAGSAALQMRTGGQQMQGKPGGRQGEKKSQRKKGNCFHCGKQGHFKSECRKRIAEEARQGSSANAAKSESEPPVAFSQVFSASSAPLEKSEDKWLGDSGASEHMCTKREAFVTFEHFPEKAKSVSMGNNAKIYAIGKGDVWISTLVDGLWRARLLKNVLCVPDLRNNLYSLGAAADEGKTIFLNKDTITVRDEGIPLLIPLPDIRSPHASSFQYRHLPLKAPLCLHTFVVCCCLYDREALDTL